MAAGDNCPKCKGIMKQGFVVDRSHTSGSLVVSEWRPGPPEKSFWLGVKSSGDSLPIGTFRCTSCGYLEQYASPEFAAK